jgi:hypothetical protein
MCCGPHCADGRLSDRLPIQEGAVIAAAGELRGLGAWERYNRYTGAVMAGTARLDASCPHGSARHNVPPAYRDAFPASKRRRSRVATARVAGRYRFAAMILVRLAGHDHRTNGGRRLRTRFVVVVDFSAPRRASAVIGWLGVSGTGCGGSVFLRNFDCMAVSPRFLIRASAARHGTQY